MDTNFNSTNNKYTFWQLLNEFTKIEIPIIQRDYAQGRPTEGKIRNKLIGHIAEALNTASPIELDFIYGMVTEKEKTVQSLFIPIDGQQRLTTLFLLHWYAAWREGVLSSVKGTLMRFTYETRPSAHSFIEYLCKESIPETIVSFRDFLVQEARWFDNEWMMDPSVEAFVIMLDCIHHNAILNSTKNLFTTLTTTDIISFYFLPIEEFGLSEEIYTRMNARGKQLTPFEKFKSKLFAVIDYDEELKKEISEKIEYKWVENLWPYVEKNNKKKDKKGKKYTIDDYFMNLLRFIALITFYERNLGEKRKKADIDLNDEDQLISVFDDQNSVRFMINTFDTLPLLEEVTGNINLYPWDNGTDGTMGKMIEDVIANNVQENVETTLLLYAALQYLLKYDEYSGIKDYLTVIRNMVINTKDKSQREWPNLLPVLKNLASENIYERLLEPDLHIEVIYSEQQKEEKRKAKLIINNPNFKPLLHRIENNIHFKGNIMSLLDGAYNGTDVDYNTLDKLYYAYKLIAKDDFNEVWGDLLWTEVYRQTQWRLSFDEYERHQSVVQLAKEVMNNNNDVEGTLLHRERIFIIDMQKKFKDLSEVNTPKEQLYLLFILSKRILGYGLYDFFRNGFQFGWLRKNLSGYSPLFNRIYDSPGMIYQCYGRYFQYNRGILENRTPKVLLAYGAGQKPFERLIEFAEEE